MFTPSNLKDLLAVAVKNGASDIHLRQDMPAYFRLKGVMAPVKSSPFAHEDLRAIAEIVIGKAYDPLAIQECDGAYEVADLCRVRFNIFCFNKKIGIIFRLIKLQVPTLQSLSLPAVVGELALKENGLVLVAGATGSGKSSTLAAMINHINITTRHHIITLEDPIEVLHTPVKSLITQREIGLDTQDFVTGLQSSLRQDPDVILIGEMRNAQTMDIALKAAETGHLVLSTVHTTDALTTIGRLVAMFPSEEQETIRKRLADSLRATICQKLVLAADGTSFLPLLEIMLNNPGVRDSILGKEDMNKIYTYMRTGDGGSQTFDQHLKYLLKKKKLTKEQAIEYSQNSGDFAKSLDFI